MPMPMNKGAKIVINQWCRVKPGEKVLIISDDSHVKESIALWKAAQDHHPRGLHTARADVRFAVGIFSTSRFGHRCNQFFVDYHQCRPGATAKRTTLSFASSCHQQQPFDAVLRLFADGPTAGRGARPRDDGSFAESTDHPRHH